MFDVAPEGRAGIDTARLLLRPGARGTPSASGEALTRAVALSRAAERGEVRVSPSTARHLVGHGRAQPQRRAPGESVRLMLCCPTPCYEQ
jgi:hypothetical protein